MDVEMRTAVDALAAEVDDLGALLAPLPVDAWTSPTRLPGWDVTILVTHLARGIGRIAEYGATPLDVAAEKDTMSYLRYDAAALAPSVDARAREAARGQTPASLRAEMRAAIAGARDTLERLPPDTVIPSVMGPITLRAFVRTRLLEACVHGLDLRHALGAPARPTAGVLVSTVATLQELLSSPRPAALADDVAFVEAATGRRAFADARFPLFA